MNLTFRPSSIAAAATLLCSLAHAQAIDQFDVRREGNDAVLQLRFATEIAFQRSVSTRSGDLTLIFYSLVTSTNAQVRATQGMKLGAAQGLPVMSIADETERGERNRKIVLRTVDATRLAVRAGQGNRSLEIVLLGAGARVAGAQAAPARRAPAPAATPGTVLVEVTPATLPQAERRFVIVLQSSSDPNMPLTQPIPRSLQNYDVFTSERSVDGARRHEIVVGHFANRMQADAVLRQLTDFPQAAIVAAVKADVAPAVAAAAPPAPAAAGTPPSAPAMPPAPTATTPPAAAAAASATAAPEVPPATPAEIDARSDALLAAAQSAMTQQNPGAAIAPLNELLDLPPNRNTQAAQELAGVARARAGDVARARIEFETYLQLYPQGEGGSRVRRELAALPTPAPAAPLAPVRPGTETTVTGSASMSYFGGNGQVRSQDFKDSILAGVPQVAGDPQFTPDKAQQLFNDVDLTWRQRSSEHDVRFVFRDQYTSDLERSEKSRNRLSALYVDYKSLSGGYGVRLGRQSPTGGGVMGRFDGVSANVILRPKLKLSAVAGEPTEKYFESRRRFYGASLDADGLLPNFGATAYVIQQSIDAEIDRRGLGLEFRYFKGGASVFSQFDYDLLIKGINIATVQGTLIMEDNTVFNALYDRRALSMLALGNALAFEDPATPGVRYTRIADKLATTTLLALRDQIKRITPFVTQAQLGITKPVDKTWQIGASAQLTNTGAIPPVPEVLGFEKGQAATGNIYSVSGQLIGLNLYSQRDTHVLSTTGISSPNLKGLLLSYNNSSIAWNTWQFEPSLQYYRDRTPQGSTNERWTPGLRVTYRGWERWSVESSLTYELGKASRVAVDPIDPTLTTTTKESSNRANYSLGARYSF
ncbi:MAG: tetratricopeptide repeat protein [Burkholderiaceae bacterium]|nr:tetratricopeptide repeat protein [Burkholderiaceae bacterium]